MLMYMCSWSGHEIMKQPSWWRRKLCMLYEHKNWLCKPSKHDKTDASALSDDLRFTFYEIRRWFRSSLLRPWPAVQKVFSNTSCCAFKTAMSDFNKSCAISVCCSVAAKVRKQCVAIAIVSLSIFLQSVMIQDGIEQDMWTLQGVQLKLACA